MALLLPTGNIEKDPAHVTRSCPVLIAPIRNISPHGTIIIPLTPVLLWRAVSATERSALVVQWSSATANQFSANFSCALYQRVSFITRITSNLLSERMPPLVSLTTFIWFDSPRRAPSPPDHFFDRLYYMTQRQPRNSMYAVKDKHHLHVALRLTLNVFEPMSLKILPLEAKRQLQNEQYLLWCNLLSAKFPIGNVGHSVVKSEDVFSPLAGIKSWVLQMSRCLQLLNAWHSNMFNPKRVFCHINSNMKKSYQNIHQDPVSTDILIISNWTIKVKSIRLSSFRSII